jgi:phosphodiesterase/alkaline phosphatase D-like protein/predicted  nucleic acid-binding Zn ribbon protein
MATGPSSSQTPYIVPTGTGVLTTSILTVGDAAPNSTYKMAGIPDGLGAFDNGDGTFTVLMNHEIGAALGVVHAHGSTGAFVSKWVIKKSDLSVVSGDDLIKNLMLWDSTTSTFIKGTTAFARFCSADLAAPTAFYNSATGLGTTARIFLNGEETGVEGRAFGNIASGPNTGTTYELPYLGKFSWENAVASPAVSNKTVVVGTDDGQNGQVYVYVGTKTNTGTDIDKAGLNNGKLFGIKVTGLVDELAASTPAIGSRFSLADLGQVQNTTGAALDAASETAQVTSFLRPEDGAWDPSSPRDFYFNTTHQLDQVSDGVGTQVGNSRVWRLRFDDPTNPEAGGTIEAVIDGTTDKDTNGNSVKVNMLDNMGIDRYGHILLNEDVGGNAHNGKIWQYDIATDRLTQIAKFDPARFGDVAAGVITPATAPFTNDEESSGIIDVQDILGAGWFLVDAQAHYPISATTSPGLVEGGQLLAIFNPTTAASAATAKGKVGFSGVAAGDATTSSEILWTRTVDAATKQGIATNLTVQLSTDASFATIAKSYAGLTDANRDYTLKVDATGLTSGTKYYYRFQTGGGDTSGVGTFKTAIDPTKAAAVRFGFSGDYDGLMRPYPSTADFGKLNLDFFANIGDTMYENVSKSSVAAADPAVNLTQALIDYRAKYLENLQPTTPGGFAGLQTFFASQGNYTALDNHELGNKQLINGGAPASLALLAGNGTNDSTLDVNKTGTFINQTAGFKTLEQAYLDYQPVREKIISAPTDARTNGTVQLYNANQWGANVLYLNTDTRSYRDVRLKTSAGADDTGVRADNVDRTMLGTTQLAWLKQNLLDAQKNGTTWKFVSVTDPIDQIGAIGSGLDGGKSWIGGYRAERNDLLKYIADNGIKNVIFLSADDHQNRINEITYLDNVNDPSSVRVLAGAISVVDGPIGATGPDTITDHSFANIKALADKLAAAQTAVGVNPIGLSADFAGLKNVVREGDPNANTNRQAVDFYSPDTFNYTTFDVSADGKTLNVNVQGINSYLKDTNPEPSAANPVRSILSFSLDASTPKIPARNDFNGDSKSDILWRSDIGGVSMWQMNGSTVTSTSLTSTPNLATSWKSAGTGDFNGDGKSDILWRNDSGAVAVWTMNGSTVLSSSLTSTATLATSWKAAGTGDFDGDGKSDILWRNDSGAVAIWKMDGTTAVSSLTSTPTLATGWKAAGTGDFNGDGKSDILWRNDDGSVALWQMNGSTVVSSSLTSTPSLDGSWKINGTADFNGDGKADILWRNTNTGAVDIWQMNGATVLSSSLTSTPGLDSSWQVAGTADFSGDGKADILWRKDSGATDVWQMNGSYVVSSNLTSIQPLAAWNVAAPIL